MNRSRRGAARAAPHPHRHRAQVVVRPAGDQHLHARVGATQVGHGQPRGQAGRGGLPQRGRDALRARAVGLRVVAEGLRPRHGPGRGNLDRSGRVRHEPERTDDPGPRGKPLAAGIGLVAHAVRLVEARVGEQLRADAMRRVQDLRAHALLRVDQLGPDQLPVVRGVAGRKRRLRSAGDGMNQHDAPQHGERERDPGHARERLPAAHSSHGLTVPLARAACAYSPYAVEGLCTYLYEARSG